MQKLLIEPHYLPCFDYFRLLEKHKSVVLEVHETYQKQTYRNRCSVMSSQGRQNLIIPVQKATNLSLKEVKIEYRQDWVRQHLGAIRSNYGKSPFFEHIFPMIEPVFNKRFSFLLDLQVEFIKKIALFLGLSLDINFTVSYQKEHPDCTDKRNIILEKQEDIENIYVPYYQSFGNVFVKNLSVLDFICNEGRKSFL